MSTKVTRALDGLDLYIRTSFVDSRPGAIRRALAPLGRLLNAGEAMAELLKQRGIGLAADPWDAALRYVIGAYSVKPLTKGEYGHRHRTS